MDPCTTLWQRSVTWHMYVTWSTVARQRSDAASSANHATVHCVTTLSVANQNTGTAGGVTNIGVTCVLSQSRNSWLKQSLTPHSTQYRSFRRRSSQPITWLILTNKTVLQENTDKQTQYKSEKVNNLKYSKTKLPWFSRLLQHSARKQGGLILQRSRAHTGPNHATVHCVTTLSMANQNTGMAGGVTDIGATQCQPITQQYTAMSNIDRQCTSYWLFKVPLQRCSMLTVTEILCLLAHIHTHIHTYTRLKALCPGVPRWAGTR